MKKLRIAPVVMLAVSSVFLSSCTTGISGTEQVHNATVEEKQDVVDIYNKYNDVAAAPLTDHVSQGEIREIVRIALQDDVYSDNNDISYSQLDKDTIDKAADKTDIPDVIYKGYDDDRYYMVAAYLLLTQFITREQDTTITNDYEEGSVDDVSIFNKKEAALTPGESENVDSINTDNMAATLYKREDDTWKRYFNKTYVRFIASFISGIADQAQNTLNRSPSAGGSANEPQPLSEQQSTDEPYPSSEPEPWVKQ